MGPAMPLVLASRSPRRRALLDAAGIPFEQGPHPDVDEAIPAGLSPPDAARRLAERKAAAVARRLPRRRVLAADTLVFLGDTAFGKPRDAAQARRTLRRLSGGRHAVATGVAVAEGDALASGVAVTEVVFRPLSGEEIDAYVATGEPMDKAGAYAIQGGAAAFVEAVEGDEDTVIGLSVRLVRRLLERLDRGAAQGPAGA
ncbi:MAG: Maf family protein [Planctomycetota bacterium]|jgi:septum formation protein